MNEENTPSKPTTNVQVTSHDEDTEKIKAYLVENGKSLLFLALLLIGATAGYAIYRNYNYTVAQRASVMLSKAESPDQLREIVDNYPKSPSAPYALSSIAGASHRDGKYDEAAALYQRLETEYGKEPYLQIAIMGRLQSLEARGDLEEALDGFKKFAADYPAHYLQPVAVMGQARCLEQLGRLADARVIYEDFIAANPESPWTPQVEQALRFVARKEAGK